MKFESFYDSYYTYQVSCPLYNYFIEKLGETKLSYPRNRVKITFSRRISTTYNFFIFFLNFAPRYNATKIAKDQNEFS